MRNRATISCVDPPMTLGETCCPAIESNSGSFSSLAITGDLLQGLAVGGGVTVAARITAVGTEVTARRPSAFCAVTLTRSVLPWSTCFRRYVFSLAPLTSAQLPPSWSHRRHA